MTVVAPIAATPYNTGTSSFGATPYVNTRDGDSSYIVIAPTGVGGSTWRCQLPASSTCRPVESVDALVEARFVAGTGENESPAYDLGPTVALQRWNATLGLFQFITTAEYFLHTPAGVLQDMSGKFAYALYRVPMSPQMSFGYSVQTLVDELAAGNLYITLFQQWSGDDQYDIRVTYAAVEFLCSQTVVKVRQRQRDDFRQRQRESRQLAPRGRSYI